LKIFSLTALSAFSSRIDVVDQAINDGERVGQNGR
jgi:hypothetical protein